MSVASFIPLYYIKQLGGMRKNGDKEPRRVPNNQERMNGGKTCFTSEFLLLLRWFISW